MRDYLSNREKKSIWDILHKKEIRFWNERYRKKKKYYGEHPSWLAQQAIKYFKKAKVNKILELASGQGRDAFFFAENNFYVTATDVSPVAIEDLKKEVVKRGLVKYIKAEVLDLRGDFPYLPLSFDASYSNLGLHYFNEEQLKEIFNKVDEMLLPGKPFIFSVNCIHDAYYGLGKRLADNIFEKEGRARYFFNRENLYRFLETRFKVERLAEKEEVVDLFLKRKQSYFAVFAFKKNINIHLGGGRIEVKEKTPRRW